MQGMTLSGPPETRAVIEKSADAGKGKRDIGIHKLVAFGKGISQTQEFIAF